MAYGETHYIWVIFLNNIIFLCVAILFKSEHKNKTLKCIGTIKQCHIIFVFFVIEYPIDFLWFRTRAVFHISNSIKLATEARFSHLNKSSPRGTLSWRRDPPSFLKAMSFCLCARCVWQDAVMGIGNIERTIYKISLRRDKSTWHSLTWFMNLFIYRCVPSVVPSAQSIYSGKSHQLSINLSKTWMAKKNKFKLKIINKFDTWLHHVRFNLVAYIFLFHHLRNTRVQIMRVWDCSISYIHTI